MITIASVAKRKLQGLNNRYHEAGAEPANVARFAVPGVTAFGYYENPTGVSPSIIVIGDRGLSFPLDPDLTPIAFDSLVEATLPTPETGRGDIELVDRQGRSTMVRVAGGEGQFQDHYTMLTFLKSVVRLVQKRT